MNKIALFKLVRDKLEFVGYFDTQEDINAYLLEIKNIMDEKHQHQLGGEYLALPTIYYNLQRTTTSHRR